MASVVTAGADGDSSSKVLGYGEYVRDHALLLEGPHGAQLGQPGLGLVQDQKRAPGLAPELQLPQPALGEVNHPAGAEQRLGNDGRQLPVQLGIQ